MKKRLVLALTVPLLVGVPRTGFCGEQMSVHLGGEDPTESATAEGACRTIAAIVRVYPAFEVRTEVSAGCRVLASGPTSSMEGEVPPDAAVRELLQQDGWEEDPAYAADGPGTTSFALRKGGTVCIVSAGTPSGIDDGTIFTDDTSRFEAWCKFIRP